MLHKAKQCPKCGTKTSRWKKQLFIEPSGVRGYSPDIYIVRAVRTCFKCGNIDTIVYRDCHPFGYRPFTSLKAALIYYSIPSLIGIVFIIGLLALILSAYNHLLG